MRAVAHASGMKEEMLCAVSKQKVAAFIAASMSDREMLVTMPPLRSATFRF